MGFCFFNNVALAALSLLQQGLERVLIFDWVSPVAVVPCMSSPCKRCLIAAPHLMGLPQPPKADAVVLQDVHHGNGALCCRPSTVHAARLFY